MHEDGCANASAKCGAYGRAFGDAYSFADRCTNTKANGDTDKEVRLVDSAKHGGKGGKGDNNKGGGGGFMTPRGGADTPRGCLHVMRRADTQVALSQASSPAHPCTAVADAPKSAPTTKTRWKRSIVTPEMLGGRWPKLNVELGFRARLTVRFAPTPSGSRQVNVLLWV